MTPRSLNFIGAFCATLAVVFFSANDTIVKFLSDSYALHQVVLIRSVIGLAVVVTIIMPLSGGLSVMRTKRFPMHALRGCAVVFANMTFFLALAAMPLAEAVAIFFISPTVVTVFSVIFLGETVGPRRWTAIAVGLLGVLIVVRPGTDAFQIASLLPLAAAVGYAFIHIIARRIGGTESAATMTFYMQLIFIFICLGIGLVVGDGRFDTSPDPSWSFLLRAWVWPDPSDYPLLLAVGVGIATAGFLISQAYRVAEAGFVAPFEYLALPMGIFWGVIVFGDYPDTTTIIGASLIIASGIFNIWRESQLGRADPRPRHRR